MELPLRNIKALFSKYIIRRSAIGMWNRRAKQYGVRAVLNIGHCEEEVEAVTRMQMEHIFPALKEKLTGTETTILDFGCGPGRFTPYLAALINGNAIGVDPIQSFLDVAPRGENVEYRLMNGGAIPVADRSIDVIWICLVLGGIIKERALINCIREVDRVLKPQGLIVLAENTTESKDVEYWKFRSVEYYRNLFYFSRMELISDYYDLGERISIMMGRKQ